MKCEESNLEVSYLSRLRPVVVQAFTGFLILTSVFEIRALAAQSAVAGTWKGKLHGLPGVRLSVKDTGGKLSGAITFYLLHRDKESDPWQVDTKHSTPCRLINPRLKGKIFSFEVSHRGAHPPRTLSDTELVRFQMELRGPNEAELKRLNYGTEDGVVKITKEH